MKANEDRSYIGSFVLGMGFVMPPEEAEALIAKEPRNRDVLFPYLNGEDLNSRPDQSASRWVINFHDWPLDRSAKGSWAEAEEKQRAEWRRSGRAPADYPHSVAADFPDCLAIVEEKVRPERQRRKADGTYQLRDPLPLRYWQHADKRRELYATIASFDRVLVVALVNNHLGFALVPNRMVYAHRLAVLPFEREDAFAVMQSSLHYHWAWEYSSTLRRDINYSPSDCVETFPFVLDHALLNIGARYMTHRAALMAASGDGLTTIYNGFHSRRNVSAGIAELRSLHIRLDEAVVRAYGWGDLRMSHGFHDIQQGTRFTVSPAARQEILDRLLELNHQRYAEEVAQGLHEKVASKNKTGTPKKSKKTPNASPRLEGM